MRAEVRVKTSAPRTWTEQVLGRRRFPAKSWRRVDLPAPLAPMSRVREPFGRLRFMLWRAGLSASGEWRNVRLDISIAFKFSLELVDMFGHQDQVRSQY